MEYIKPEKITECISCSNSNFDNNFIVTRKDKFAVTKKRKLKPAHYFECSNCGLFTLDGAEEGSFKERWKNIDSQFTLGSFTGIGIDFKMYGQTTVSPMVGYEILPLKYNA